MRNQCAFFSHIALLPLDKRKTCLSFILYNWEMKLWWSHTNLESAQPFGFLGQQLGLWGKGCLQELLMPTVHCLSEKVSWWSCSHLGLCPIRRKHDSRLLRNSSWNRLYDIPSRLAQPLVIISNYVSLFYLCSHSCAQSVSSQKNQFSRAGVRSVQDPGPIPVNMWNLQQGECCPGSLKIPCTWRAENSPWHLS